MLIASIRILYLSIRIFDEFNSRVTNAEALKFDNSN